MRLCCRAAFVWLLVCGFDRVITASRARFSWMLSVLASDLGLALADQGLTVTALILAAWLFGTGQIAVAPGLALAGWEEP